MVVFANDRDAIGEQAITSNPAVSFDGDVLANINMMTHPYMAWCPQPSSGAQMKAIAMRHEISTGEHFKFCLQPSSRRKQQ